MPSSNSIPTKTDTTSSSGYYSVSVATPDYEYYNLQIIKTGYKTNTQEVWSSGTNRKDIAIWPPVVQICVSTPDFATPTEGDGNTIKTTIRLYDNYAIATIKIKYSLGSGEIKIKNDWWSYQSKSCYMVDADGTKTPLDSWLQDELVIFGNNYIFYEDGPYDFGNNHIEINAKVKIPFASFKLEFATIARTCTNTHMFYQPLGLYGDASVVAYEDPVADMMSNILNWIYNDFISDLYGPELPAIYEMFATIAGLVFGAIEPASHGWLRLQFHGP
jgi:hypothetical protein